MSSWTLCCGTDQVITRPWVLPYSICSRGHYHLCWLMMLPAIPELDVRLWRMCDERTRHSGTSIIHFYLHLLYMTTCIIHSPDDKCPLAPLASRAASVDTPTTSPYATDSRSFQLPITVPWHHGSNRAKWRMCQFAAVSCSKPTEGHPMSLSQCHASQWPSVDLQLTFRVISALTDLPKFSITKNIINIFLLLVSSV